MSIRTPGRTSLETLEAQVNNSPGSPQVLSPTANSTYTRTPLRRSRHNLLSYGADRRDRILILEPRVQIEQEGEVLLEPHWSSQFLLFFAPNLAQWIDKVEGSSTRVVQLPPNSTNQESIHLVIDWMLLCVFAPRTYNEDFYVHEKRFPVPNAVRMHKVFSLFRMGREVVRVEEGINKYLRIFKLPLEQIESVWLMEKKDVNSVWVQKIAENISSKRYGTYAISRWDNLVYYWLERPENEALNNLVKNPNWWRRAAEEFPERERLGNHMRWGGQRPIYTLGRFDRKGT